MENSQWHYMYTLYGVSSIMLCKAKYWYWSWHWGIQKQITTPINIAIFYWTTVSSHMGSLVFLQYMLQTHSIYHKLSNHIEISVIVVCTEGH